MQVTLAAGILGRLGDPDGFANLAGVRAFTGLVPSVSRSGNTENPRQRHQSRRPRLRRAPFLAAEHARRVDPALAAKYHRLVVDRGTHYTIRDTDGRAIPPTRADECRRDWTVPSEIRRRNTTARRAKQLRQRTGRRNQKSTGTAAPATDPSTPNLPTTPATTA